MNEHDTFARDWSKQFAIDSENLEEEVTKQASSYSYYAVRCVKAKNAMERAKYLADRKLSDAKSLLSQLSVMYSQKVVGHSSKGEPKYMTVQGIEAAAKADQRYISIMEEHYALLDEFLKLKETADIYDADVRASAQKGDSLKSLSFNLSVELRNKNMGGL